jgi:hypothetical protein
MEKWWMVRMENGRIFSKRMLMIKNGLKSIIASE